MLSIVPLLTVGLVSTPQWRGLVWDHGSISIVQGVAIAARGLGGLYWVVSIYGHTLIGIEVLLVLRLVFVSDYPFEDQIDTKPACVSREDA